MKKFSNTKNTLFYLLACFVSISANAQHGDDEIRDAILGVGGPEKFLKIIERKTANALPHKLNSDVLIVSVISQGKEIKYVNKMINVRKEDVSDMGKFSRLNTNYAGCGLPTSRIMINEFGSKYTHIAVDLNNKYLFQYTLDSKSCKNN